MNLVCYNNNSPKNKVTKDLTELFTLTGKLREGTSMVNPTIIVEKTIPPLFNYCYIPDFYRYYFVESINNINNKLWSISLHCDVLSTYWNNIKTCDCIVSRNEFKRINDLRDDEIWTTADSLYSVIQFPNTPFDVQTGTDIRYVMILAGAGSDGVPDANDIVTWTPVGDLPLEIYNSYYIDPVNNNKVGVSLDYTTNGVVKFYYVPQNVTLYFSASYVNEDKNYQAVYDVSTSSWIFTEV